MVPLLTIFMVGFTVMLGIMGVQQWQRGYRIAAGFSLVTATALGGVSMWVLLAAFGLL